MKEIGIITLTIIFITASAVIYLILSERESNSFVSYKMVEMSGLISRGWVPSFIPKSSYDIEEHHKVDVASIYVELYFKPEDISYFEKACKLYSVNIFRCHNFGHPVKVTITDGNHAIIESI